MTVKLLSGPAALGLPPSRAILHTLQLWLARTEERRQLLDLDARMLRDIGMTRGQAELEAAKPFWAE